MPTNRSRLLKDLSFSLDSAELAAKIRLDADDREDAAAFQQLLSEARRIANPGALWRECRLEKIAGDVFVIDGIEFSGRAPARLLAGRTRVFAYCATCGVETDRLLRPDDPLRNYWAEEIRMQLMHAALAAARQKLMEETGIPRLASLAPGSGETEQVWPIAQLKGLFELAAGDFSSRLKVTLTDSCLMLPTKTVAGLFFEAEHDFSGCQVCRREGCPNRKTPFDDELWADLHRESGDRNCDSAGHASRV